MKERIKKFCKDHKSQVTIAALGATATAMVALKLTRGNQVVGLDDFMRMDGRPSVVVIKRNGNTKTFTRSEPFKAV